MSDLLPTYGRYTAVVRHRYRTHFLKPRAHEGGVQHALSPERDHVCLTGITHEERYFLAAACISPLESP